MTGEEAPGYAIGAELLPDYRAWLALNPGLTLGGYARLNVGTDQFFAAAALLWPRIIEHRGGVFLADGFEPARFDAWHRQTSGNLDAIERVMNHRHMRDMLAALREAPASALMATALLVSECWAARLSHLFPGRPTRVEITETEFDVEVTSFAARP